MSGSPSKVGSVCCRQFSWHYHLVLLEHEVYLCYQHFPLYLHICLFDIVSGLQLRLEIPSSAAPTPHIRLVMSPSGGFPFPIH